MEPKTKKGLIVVGALLAIATIGFFIYKKVSKKGDESKTLEENKETQTPGGSEAESSTSTTTTPNTTTPKKNVPAVIVSRKGTSLFSTDMKATTRKTSSDNENVGAFAGYRTLNGNVMVLFADRYNQNKPTLAFKSSVGPIKD
jgi:hypothetical protein